MAFPDLPAAAVNAQAQALASALVRAVDTKDPYTRSHSETVSDLCGMIATELGLKPERVAKIRRAGLFHDVGKIGTPDEILKKPARLTDAELELIKQHPVIGASITDAAGLKEEARWILHHHERPDGQGYPDGLSGEEIPLESRIILVADAYQAITSDRPYRERRSELEALAEIERHVGVQFDPACVAALRSALEIAGADDEPPLAVQPVELTEREREVMALVASGLHSDEMAERLCVSPETIKSHVQNAMGKLGAHTRAHAVAIALVSGQISSEI